MPIMPKSMITSQYSAPIQNDLVKAVCRRLQDLDSDLIAFLKSIYKAVDSGRLTHLEPEIQTNIQANAKSVLDEIQAIEKQFKDVVDARWEFGEGYLKDERMLFHWKRPSIS